MMSIDKKIEEMKDYDISNIISSKLVDIIEDIEDLEVIDRVVSDYISNKPGREFLYTLANGIKANRGAKGFIWGKHPIRGMTKRHDKDVIIAAAFGMLVDDLKPQKGMSQKELKDIETLKRLRNEGLI